MCPTDCFLPRRPACPVVAQPLKRVSMKKGRQPATDGPFALQRLTWTAARQKSILTRIPAVRGSPYSTAKPPPSLYSSSVALLMKN